MRTTERLYSVTGNSGSLDQLESDQEPSYLVMSWHITFILMTASWHNMATSAPDFVSTFQAEGKGKEGPKKIPLFCKGFLPRNPRNV